MPPFWSHFSQAAWVICMFYSVGGSGSCLPAPLSHVFCMSLRRSATLRTYPGDTSLPGGKVEPEDMSWEDTAVSSPKTFTRKLSRFPEIMDSRSDAQL